MQPSTTQKYRGYAALLALLIVLAIGMMLYFLDMQAIWGPGRYMNSQNRPQQHPWEMENLLIEDNQPISVPGKGQPELLEPVHLTIPVIRNKSPRGTVQIAFAKDCRITAQWSAQYQHEQNAFQIQAQLKGNTVSSKHYCDAAGNTDKTQLFFIGKGPWLQTTQSTGETTQTEEGTAYITGWLGPDHAVLGTLTITTDQSWSAAYEFQSSSQNQTNK